MNINNSVSDTATSNRSKSQTWQQLISVATDECNALPETYIIRLTNAQAGDNVIMKVIIYKPPSQSGHWMDVMTTRRLELHVWSL